MCLYPTPCARNVEIKFGMKLSFVIPALYRAVDETFTSARLLTRYLEAEEVREKRFLDALLVEIRICVAIK